MAPEVTDDQSTQNQNSDKDQIESGNISTKRHPEGILSDTRTRSAWDAADAAEVKSGLQRIISSAERVTGCDLPYLRVLMPPGPRGVQIRLLSPLSSQAHSLRPSPQAKGRFIKTRTSRHESSCSSFVTNLITLYRCII
ncbi:hypothetical protein LDENG_00080900 [Xyrichtys novacula]|uniref:Uncharacterized protein n=1 Tax=Xyrichtys novacula TaxID=13765 RepID=A0AAV1FFN2_XYRNO|nr:hypothetical protein LDENG_00080900 [Xyrichtys novacula]